MLDDDADSSNENSNNLMQFGLPKLNSNEPYNNNSNSKHYMEQSVGSMNEYLHHFQKKNEGVFADMKTNERVSKNFQRRKLRDVMHEYDETHLHISKMSHNQKKIHQKEKEMNVKKEYEYKTKYSISMEKVMQSIVDMWPSMKREYTFGRLGSQIDPKTYFHFYLAMVETNLLTFCVHYCASKTSLDESDYLQMIKQLISIIDSKRWGEAWEYLHNQEMDSQFAQNARHQEKDLFYIWKILCLIVIHHSQGLKEASKSYQYIVNILSTDCPWRVILKVLDVAFLKIPNTQKSLML